MRLVLDASVALKWFFRDRDAVYARKARHLGRLLPLQDWATGTDQRVASP